MYKNHCETFDNKSTFSRSLTKHRHRQSVTSNQVFQVNQVNKANQVKKVDQVKQVNQGSSMTRVTSVKSSIGIFAHQGHISKVNICLVIHSKTSLLEPHVALKSTLSENVF